MTIDEAIQRCCRIAEKNKKLWETTHPAFRLFDYEKCASENIQVAEWLKDYKRLLEQQPCEDAISRQAVLEGIVIIAKAKAKSDAQKSLMGRVLFFTEHLPSVNPQPNTGHWVSIDEEPHEVYECDRCGRVVSTFTANIEPHIEYKYCPNCGAKMIEPQESEDEK